MLIHPHPGGDLLSGVAVEEASRTGAMSYGMALIASMISSRIDPKTASRTISGRVWSFLMPAITSSGTAAARGMFTAMVLCLLPDMLGRRDGVEMNLDPRGFLRKGSKTPTLLVNVSKHNQLWRQHVIHTPASARKKKHKCKGRRSVQYNMHHLSSARPAMLPLNSQSLISRSQKVLSGAVLPPFQRHQNRIIINHPCPHPHHPHSHPHQPPQEVPYPPRQALPAHHSLPHPQPSKPAAI